MSKSFQSIQVEGFDAYIIKSSCFGKFFTLRWRVGEKYKYRSLRTRNYAKAMKNAKTLMTKIERGISPDTKTNYEEAFEDYLRSTTCGRARRNQIEQIHYKWLLPYFKRMEVNLIGTAVWEGYKTHRLEMVKAAGEVVRFKTLHHERALMKAFLRYCVRMSLISALPEITAWNKHLTAIEASKQRGAAYSPEELNAVFSLLKSRVIPDADLKMEPYYAHALYVYCLVLFLSAGRAGEIRQLKVGDIELKGEVAVITIRSETSKVKKQRRTAIPRSAAMVLEEFIQWSNPKRPPGGYVFYNYNHSPKAIATINQTYKRLMTEAGLYENEDGVIRPVSSLRNTAITLMSDKVNQAFLVAIAGTSERMVRKHYHDRRAEAFAEYTEEFADTLVAG